MSLVPSPDTVSACDTRWMSRAIQLAKRGYYTTRPNPNVGCVIVAADQQQVAGEGWHYRAGEAHAEVHALRRAGAGAAGATAYVTLEPCNHQGRTGPCTQALIKAGIARVVYGMTDPNPLVAGQGLETLERAGVEVAGPVLPDQCRALNLGFISRMERRRPWVRCKMAASIDGRTAMADGSSQWISGPAARADVQQWRARSGAVMTGIGSILQDNSRLSLRSGELTIANGDDALAMPPLRVVLDSQLRIPVDAAIFAPDSLTVIMTTERAYREQGDKVSQLRARYPSAVAIAVMPENNAGQLSLAAVLRHLSEHYQCNDVLLETGAVLAGAFLQADLIDELILYQAPIIMGSEARPLFNGAIDAMADKRPLSIIDRRQYGQDQRIIARFIDAAQSLD